MRRLILPALLLAALPLAADVYKSVDENGNAVYTDRPVPGAERVQVGAAFLGGGPVPRAPLPGSEPEPEDPEDAEETAASGETAPSPAQQAAQREQNCAAARERSERYTTSHRLYRTTGDGEREYLTSAEIDEARAQAAADVEQWCN